MSGVGLVLLPTTTITTALTGSVAATNTLGPGSDDSFRDPTNVVLQCAFAYGSGGTTADAYVQTSLDNGATWFDVANFHFTTSTATKVSALTSLIAPAAQAFAPTDGSLSANTIVQGILGPLWRVKLTTTGTYAGGTTMTVWMTIRGTE